MHFWIKNHTEFQTMEALRHEHPGLKPAEIAEALEAARSTGMRRRPSLEEAGFLYSEDKRGGLWPFSRGK